MRLRFPPVNVARLFAALLSPAPPAERERLPTQAQTPA